MFFYSSFNSSYFFILSTIAAFKKAYSIPVPYRLDSGSIPAGVVVCRTRYSDGTLIVPFPTIGLPIVSSLCRRGGRHFFKIKINQ
ncbi:hypothetical protein DDI_3755 [Dickeya dianthicola RNS04.9]|nr:hypothetical protein DDI_3755 [Dickeya dianthicola RNS04.9]